MLSAVVDADGNHVVLSRNKIFAQVEIMRGGKTFIKSFYLHSVNPYLRVPDDTFQGENYIFIFPFFGNRDFFSVPCRTQIIELPFQIQEDFFFHNRLKGTGSAITGITKCSGKENPVRKGFCIPLFGDSFIQAVQRHFPFS